MRLNASKEELIKDYEELFCLTKIANKYGVHRQTVANRFDKLGLEYKSKIHRYSSDENFFSHDNEVTFYWAGFLAADGCVYHRKDGFEQVVLKLAAKDLSHMKAFKSYVKSDAPLSLYRNKNSLRNSNWNDTDQYQLRIASHQMVQDLKRFNIVPRKTKTYDLPEFMISHKLVNHFLRGYFDGDGCVSNSSQWSWSIRGNIHFLSTFKDILENNCHLDSKAAPQITSGTGELRFNGRLMIGKITRFLYGDATVFLPRKYDIAKRAKL